jgi:diguanylate cyclase (GGDEF)-like protein
LFVAQAEYALDMARQNASMVGVAIIDLDGFKPINDDFGHAAGDEVLVEVAKRLSSAVGDNLVARLGGDEFGIVTWINSHEVALSRLARDVKLAFKRPFVIDGGAKTYLSASVGTALYPTDGETLETLLKAADSRMYGLKRALGRQAEKSIA